MNYRKPEVAALGPAAELIEGSQVKTGTKFDGQLPNPNRAIVPAYDLDE